MTVGSQGFLLEIPDMEFDVIVTTFSILQFKTSQSMDICVYLEEDSDG